MDKSVDFAPAVEVVQEGASKLIENIKSVICIDRLKLEYIIAAKIAGGHVMLADSHGVGKTSLARALAGSIDWAERDFSQEGVEVEPFSRIQCTVDLLPQDILGYTRIDSTTSSLIFTRGPIFAHFVLCDEINLLTPKTQGSFFQAMEEQTVTIEGKTYHLEDPFFIIATMNLKGAHLFPLPAPQLDRFMIQLSMGYPDTADEISIVNQHGRDDGWTAFGPTVKSEDIISWRRLVDEVTIHEEVVSYIVNCVRKTRQHPDVQTGASPRTGVKVSRLVRALALVRGMDFVNIDMVKEVFHNAVSHRLIMKDPDMAPQSVIDSILETVPVEPR
ncbi:MAG: MoxR family ATPase [Spirochaetales bacterium]|nr:MoxR family ATPase [Spirochaetales bacterium]